MFHITISLYSHNTSSVFVFLVNISFSRLPVSLIVTDGPRCAMPDAISPRTQCRHCLPASIVAAGVGLFGTPSPPWPPPGPPRTHLTSILPRLCLKVLCYLFYGPALGVKINAVNTTLWMNKSPPDALWATVNKLIHGVIHSLTRLYPPQPTISVCCYFRDSAERNHKRRNINHISPV